MDADRFDHMTHAFATAGTRRGLVAVMAAALGGATAAWASLTAEAKKRKRKKKRRKKKPTYNEFGCVDVGNYCKNNGQCCSGICEGNECQAHGESTCQPGDDYCLGTVVFCTTSTGLEGTCGPTTGKASYCAFDGSCFPCQKDADCQSVCGPQAACVVCAPCQEQIGSPTTCSGPSLCFFQ